MLYFNPSNAINGPFLSSKVWLAHDCPFELRLFLKLIELQMLSFSMAMMHF